MLILYNTITSRCIDFDFAKVIYFLILSTPKTKKLSTLDVDNS